MSSACQKHNSQKVELEDSLTSEERCQEGYFQEDLYRSALVNRIKNFLLHTRKDPMTLVYYLQYKNKYVNK